MAAVAKGKEIERTVGSLNKQTAPLAKTAEQAKDGAQGGAFASQFGRRFDAGNEKWEQRTAIKQALSDDKGSTPFGQIYFQKEDADALLRYEQAAREAAFDSYFGKNFHVNDLATRRLAQELYPEWYEQRERAMIDRAKAAIIIKNIMLRGPKDEKELQILYGLQSGDIQLGADWDRIGDPDPPLLGSQSRPFTSELTGQSLLFVPAAQRADRVTFGTAPFQLQGQAAFRAPFESANYDPRNLKLFGTQFVPQFPRQ